MISSEHQQKLERLKTYLEVDPDNPALLRDCAEGAMEAGDMEAANICFDRLEKLAGLSDEEAGNAGLAAMRSGRIDRAAELFEALSDAHPDDAALRFNLAWSLALGKDFERAQSKLDEATIISLPQAAVLDLQLSHQQGDFDGAAEKVAGYLAAHGTYPPLQAAISVLAMDLDDEGLAREAALAGGDHPDALATLGTLALGEGDPATAREILERSLAQNPQSPRALMGLGLANLALGNANDALQQVDRGAELFEDHLGSWIAAGWAHLVAGDRDTAEHRFATAMRLDDNFAECHGSLAVIAALNGDRTGAEQAIQIARRLDRQSFSAGFAQMLLVASDGNADGAREMLEKALDQPLAADGRTLRQLIGRLAR